MRLPTDPAAIERAAELLRAGGLVAFPTETVYGLGARADDDAAVGRIFALKGRPADNPTIVHVASAEAAFALVDSPSDAARSLAQAFWPGPLTLVVRAKPGAVSAVARAGGATVALRVPAHPVARALLLAAGVPVAAPSANRSTAISPTTAEHVEKSLGGGVLVLDAGPTGFGIESTIVDVTSSLAVVLRRGSVSREEIARVAGGARDAADRVEVEGAPMRAPGAMARHYAPRVPLLLTALPSAAAFGSGAGYLLLEGAIAPSDAAAVRFSPAEPAAYAALLYASLHALEDAGVDRIVVQEPPVTPEWAAVNDRLRRASAR
ncbi:MAG: threonylcarbamoyl-AMP synthase [Polyangiaceae bacterium]|nr:threonylcarbamoyl-AMP synthase [Polyangiaceae bacterium]